jgi:hypothetical protein
MMCLELQKKIDKFNPKVVAEKKKKVTPKPKAKPKIRAVAKKKKVAKKAKK